MVVFKVYPEAPEDVERVEKGLREIKAGEFKDLKKEPLAFGMELIRVGYLIPDKTEGVMDALENAVRNVPGVSNAEVEAQTLV